MALNKDQASAPHPRAPWFRREPIDLGEVLVEILAVVLGVLIAMAIGRWHEQRKDQETIDSALHTVRLELDRNRAAVAAFAGKLKASSEQMRDANKALIASAQSREHWRPCMAYQAWAGFVPPMLLDTAYEVAIATGALAKMPYRQASVVGGAYGAQRHVQKMYDKTGALLFGMEPKPLSGCVGLQREMASASNGLVAALDATLQALPEPAEPPRD